MEEADAEFDQSEANFLKEIAKLKSDLEAKDRELKEVKKQNLSLEKELTEADKDIDDLEDEIKKLKSAKNNDEKVIKLLYTLEISNFRGDSSSEVEVFAYSEFRGPSDQI